eukprot:14781957-Alexandrium_andersonii.AAC.1
MDPRAATPPARDDYANHATTKPPHLSFPSPWVARWLCTHARLPHSATIPLLETGKIGGRFCKAQKPPSTVTNSSGDPVPHGLVLSHLPKG